MKEHVEHKRLLALEEAIETFRSDCGRLPAQPEGLQALVSRPQGISNWRGPYFFETNGELERDSWNHEYKYTNPGEHNTGAFDVSSAGPDGILGTGDDINNW